MEPSQQDIEKLMLCEYTRMTAEANYAKNPADTANLTKWGGALIELSQFGNINQSMKMLRDATVKLEEALATNPTEHDASWLLGNAHTSRAFLTPDRDEAQIYFDKASACYQKAVDESPGNENYLKSLESTPQAAAMYMELQKNGIGQQSMGGGGGGGGGSFGSFNAKSSGKKKVSSDLKYDICGWVILAIGLVTWVGMAKSNVPPPPAR
jgi:tetratricopeptide (TPR) repeat protein